MAEAVDPEKIPYRHGKTPGRTGYRKGCRCGQCRREHSDDMKAYRAKKKLKDAGSADFPPGYFDAPPVEPSSMAIIWSAPAGPIETALTEELDALIGEPPFKKTLLVLAKYNARVLDQIPQMERPDLISGMQSRLFNVFDRLRKVTDGEGGKVNTADEFLAGLMSEDD